MKKLFKIIKIILITFLIILVGIFSIGGYLYFSADMRQPNAKDISDEPVIVENNYRKWKNNYLRQSESGLWEMKIGGSPFERGVAVGKLSEDLLYFQEKVFVDQIKEMIPSESYLKFLRFFLVSFNRNLGKYVEEEFREEIYGISLSCTNEYNFIGTPYERQLNYHAAHDIGHALQDLMLVGCSSFAVWDDAKTDSSMIIGRNFDFYMGDDFARNKTVVFLEPDSGYKIAFVGWAGMMGVLSGMNEEGLTVTINAAKSSIPTSSATPISLLVREILQYASTIDEAYAIAQKRKTFVSESILIGSAKDKKAAIIEKSPEKISLFSVNENQIICTNHFQSDAFKNDKRNIENIETTDSYYRYQRLEELLAENDSLNENTVADILRNRFGLKNINVGLGNEMSINQDIAHHSVVFKPEERKMWVSTFPWQSGKYVMYDLNKIFNQEIDFSSELYDEEFTVKADTTFLNGDYKHLLDSRRLSRYVKEQTKNNEIVPTDSISKLEESNPEYYHIYEILGDYYKSIDNLPLANEYWQKALTKKIGRVAEKERIEEKMQTR